MARLVPALLVLLVIAIWGCPGSVDAQLDNLQYPRKSFMETLLTPPEITSDMDNLEYPKESLLSALISRLVGAFTRISSAARSFSSSLPPQLRSLLSFVGQFLQSLIGVNIFGSNSERSDSSFDDDDFKDFDENDVSLADLPTIPDDGENVFFADPPELKNEKSFKEQSTASAESTTEKTSTILSTEKILTTSTTTEKTTTTSPTTTTTTTTTTMPSTTTSSSTTTNAPTSESPIENFLNELF